MSAIRILKAPRVRQETVLTERLVYYSGDAHAVLDLVMSMRCSGQLTFCLSPEGSVGDMKFITKERLDLKS